MIGLLLAGGQARRLGGGDKGLSRVGGRRILDRVIATMRGQCEDLVLNANGEPARFAAMGVPVVADEMPEQRGPLAGILAGLDHVAVHHAHVGFVVTVPTDTPFLPNDLVARLDDARLADCAAIVCAQSGARPHYTAALWAVALRHDLRRMLVAEGVRKVASFIQRHPFHVVEWPVTPYDPFFNVNTPDDLAEAERLAREFGL